MQPLAEQKSTVSPQLISHSVGWPTDEASFSLFRTCVTLAGLTPVSAGEISPVLELAGVEQRLVTAGELEPIAWFFGSGEIRRFGFAGTVPGHDLDNSRST